MEEYKYKRVSTEADVKRYELLYRRDRMFRRSIVYIIILAVLAYLILS